MWKKQQKTRLKQKYREKKKAANKAVVKARDKKQQEWCNRIEEDGGKNLSSRDRDRDRDRDIDRDRDGRM